MHSNTATLAAFVIAATCVLPLSAIAQPASAATISGTVIDEATHSPLERVNIGLHRASDSSLVKGVVSARTSGAFAIDNVGRGVYYLRLTRTGYNVRITDAFRIDSANERIGLGAIAMVEKIVTLDDVLVTGRKEIQNNAIDRKVYNVGQDVMSKSGSAGDLLQNIPSVQVDMDGVVSLRGSSDVMILVNGKSSPMMDRNRAEALQQLSGSAIERIEVITNPSARYQPDGTAGIINIVLKSDAAPGVNGGVTVNAGNLSRYNGDVRLNYNPGRFNLFGSYTFRHDNRNRTLGIGIRQIDSAGVLTSYREDLTSGAYPISHLIALGFDADLGDATSAGASGNYFHNSFTRTDHAVNTSRDSTGALTEGYDRNRLDHEFQEDYGFTLYLQHAYPVKDKTLRLDFTFAGHPEQEDNHFTEVNWYPAGLASYNNTLIKPLENRSQLTVNFTDPTDAFSKLEAGYAGAFNHSDYNFHVTTFDTVPSAVVTDASKTSRFVCDDMIHAVYATYQHSFGAFSVMGGLRLEHEHRISNMASRDSSITKNFDNLYPSLHLAYTFGDGGELQLNYSRRVNRPETEDLNPFPEYRDPRNLIAGNAAMIPEYIHSIEFGCALQTAAVSFIPSVYYRYTSNKFNRVYTAIDDSTVQMTFTNLASAQAAGVELILSATLGDVVSAHASVNGFYEQIDASNLGFSADTSAVSWIGAFNCDVHLTKRTMLQTNMNYFGPRITPQGKGLSSAVVNVGARQVLIDRALSLMLTVTDVFHTWRRQSEAHTPLLNRTFLDTRDGGIIFLGLAYTFGTSGKESSKDNLQFDEGQ